MLDTLENVKDRLGIEDTEYDEFLTQQIQLISDVIEAYCRRKFAAANWRQTFYRDEIGSPKILELYQFPLIELDSITVDDEEEDIQDFRLHKPTARIRRTDQGWITGEEIVVDYEAGYETIPSPILEVLDSLVSQRYNKRKAGVDLNFGSDVQRVSIPGAISIDFDYSLSNNERSSSYGTILGSYANVLDDWRSERAVIGSGRLEYIEEVPEGP